MNIRTGAVLIAVGFVMMSMTGSSTHLGTNVLDYTNYESRELGGYTEDSSGCGGWNVTTCMTDGDNSTYVTWYSQSGHDIMNQGSPTTIHKCDLTGSADNVSDPLGAYVDYEIEWYSIESVSWNVRNRWPGSSDSACFTLLGWNATNGWEVVSAVETNPETKGLGAWHAFEVNLASATDGYEKLRIRAVDGKNGWGYLDIANLEIHGIAGNPDVYNLSLFRGNHPIMNSLNWEKSLLYTENAGITYEIWVNDPTFNSTWWLRDTTTWTSWDENYDLATLYIANRCYGVIATHPTYGDSALYTIC